MEDDKLTSVKAFVMNGKSASCGVEFIVVVMCDGEVFMYGLL